MKQIGRVMKKKKNTSLKHKQAVTAYSLLIPGLSFYIPFHFFPIIAVFLMSLITWKGYSFSTIEWAGLQNYKDLIADKQFWNALSHNIQFVIIVVIVQTLFSLFLAMLLEQNLPLSKFFRGIYFMPTVLSLVVVGLLFGFVLSPANGLLNRLLLLMGSKSQPAWLGEPKLALFVLMAVNVWKEFGLSMFLFIAGLESIPDDLFDAAKVDGANRWQIFSHIIFPLLMETTMVVITMATINCFKLFDLIQVMTKGGPFFATEVLATRMYTQSFKYGKIGYGSAIAVVLFLLTFSFSAMQFILRNKKNRVVY